jgi:hypothetical protein
MRRSVVVACTLLALATAPAAHGDVTIGSDLTIAPNTPQSPGPDGLTAAPANATVPADGVITRWRVRVGIQTTPIRLRVLRPSTGFEVERSDTEAAPPVDSRTVYETQIPVAQGDQIALECCRDAVGVFFVSGAGSTTIWTPAIADDGPIPSPPPVPIDVGTALNADVEPDRDRDGFGDDTQDDDDDGDGVPDTADACPTQAGSAANGCMPTPPAARVNTPAIVRFRTPTVGTAVGPAQLVELDVSDDFGTTVVTVFDDDGTVCMLSAAPYSCTWNPTGADVGRATLLASAVDADNRSSLASVRVRVARFEADLTRRVRGRQVSGRLVLPAAVERPLGCRGDVTVRRGKVRRTVALKRNCTYSVRLPRGGGTPRARFAGNSVVEPAT